MDKYPKLGRNFVLRELRLYVGGTRSFNMTIPALLQCHGYGGFDADAIHLINEIGHLGSAYAKGYITEDQLRARIADLTDGAVTV